MSDMDNRSPVSIDEEKGLVPISNSQQADRENALNASYLSIGGVFFIAAIIVFMAPTSYGFYKMGDNKEDGLLLLLTLGSNIPFVFGALMPLIRYAVLRDEFKKDFKKRNEKPTEVSDLIDFNEKQGSPSCHETGRIGNRSNGTEELIFPNEACKRCEGRVTAKEWQRMWERHEQWKRDCELWNHYEECRRIKLLEMEMESAWREVEFDDYTLRVSAVVVVVMVLVYFVVVCTLPLRVPIPTD